MISKLLPLLFLLGFAACDFVCFNDDTVPGNNDDSLHNALRNANADPVHLFVGYNRMFSNVSAALNAVPLNSTKRHIIHVGPGVYREKIVVPPGKDFVTLVGAGTERTIIVYNDTAKTAPGTDKSATFTVLARYFVAKYLTFQNDAPYAYNGAVGAQAVALHLNEDFTAIIGCNIVSSQDTLYDHRGRHYFSQTRIEGNVDFIFGQARSLYKYCDIISNNIGNAEGSITAQSRSASTPHSSGFSFDSCYIGGTAKLILGRPWKDMAFVVFQSSYMTDVVSPAGWNAWNIQPAHLSNITFIENGNYGPGSDTTNRVPWIERSIKDDDVAFMYRDISFVAGEEWLVQDYFYPEDPDLEFK